VKENTHSSNRHASV